MEPEINVPTPIEIYNHLSEESPDQLEVNKVLSVSVYNHFKILQNLGPEKSAYNIGNFNLILLGRSNFSRLGLVRAVAKILHVPFASCDFEKLTRNEQSAIDLDLVQKLHLDAKGDVKRAERGIVLLDNIDKIKPLDLETNGDADTVEVQQKLSKLIRGLRAEVATNNKVDTTNILFIAFGNFPGIEACIKRREEDDILSFLLIPAERYELLNCYVLQDLINFGMLPDLIKCFSIVKVLTPADPRPMATCEFLAIGYEELFKKIGVRLSFAPGALETVVKQTIIEDIGSEGVRLVMDRILMDAMFKVPGSAIKSVEVTKDAVLGRAKPTYRYSRSIWPRDDNKGV